MDELKTPKRAWNWKRLGMLVGGVVALGLGFVLASAWTNARDSVFLAAGAILLMPGGAYLIYGGIKKHEVGNVIVGADATQGSANSLNIYARKDKDTGKIYPERVVFEQVVKPMGQPQQCLNNNRWYYVHIWDIETGRLKPFTLPDRQYFDPREFANVIKMPAHKKLFERQASLMQKIAPFAMAAIFGIAVFALIATTPPAA